MPKSLFTALGLLLAAALAVSCSDQLPTDSPATLDALELCETPPGGEGCTPGYWKVRPHLDDWAPTGYSYDDVYVDVFGDGPAITLHEAVSLKGNTINSFIRHSVAALLNASHPDVAYDLTVAQVIAKVQEAWSSGDFTSTKNLFEVYNELGCSIS